jgi:hypothetical protein
MRGATTTRSAARAARGGRSGPSPSALRPSLNLVSWLLPNPKLSPGERVLWRRTGSLSRPRGWVGGTLVITTARVMFVPGRLAFSLAPGKAPQFTSTDLVSVGVEDRDYTPYTGGMRKRLRLTSCDGQTMLVAVKGLDQAVEEVQKLIAA